MKALTDAKRAEYGYKLSTLLSPQQKLLMHLDQAKTALKEMVHEHNRERECSCEICAERAGFAFLVDLVSCACYSGMHSKEIEPVESILKMGRPEPAKPSSRLPLSTRGCKPVS